MEFCGGSLVLCQLIEPVMLWLSSVYIYIARRIITLGGYSERCRNIENDLWHDIRPNIYIYIYNMYIYIYIYILYYIFIYILYVYIVKI